MKNIREILEKRIDANVEYAEFLNEQIILTFGLLKEAKKIDLDEHRKKVKIDEIEVKVRVWIATYNKNNLDIQTTIEKIMRIDNIGTDNEIDAKEIQKKLVELLAPKKSRK